MVSVSVPSTLVDFFADERNVVVELGGVAFEGLMPANGVISFPVPAELGPGPQTLTLLATLITGDSFAQRCSGLILPELPPQTPTPTPEATGTARQETDGVAGEPARIEGSEVESSADTDETASAIDPQGAPDTGQTELLLTGVFLLLGAASFGLGRRRSNRSPRSP
jgi:hypothetical protein